MRREDGQWRTHRDRPTIRNLAERTSPRPQAGNRHEYPAEVSRRTGCRNRLVVAGDYHRQGAVRLDDVSSRREGNQTRTPVGTGGYQLSEAAPSRIDRRRSHGRTPCDPELERDDLSGRIDGRRG